MSSIKMNEKSTNIKSKYITTAFLLPGYSCCWFWTYSYRYTNKIAVDLACCNIETMLQDSFTAVLLTRKLIGCGLNVK